MINLLVAIRSNASKASQEVTQIFHIIIHIIIALNFKLCKCDESASQGLNITNYQQLGLPPPPHPTTIDHSSHYHLQYINILAKISK